MAISGESMRVIAIGDIQGCQRALLTLLEKVNFDPASDQLWLTGDIVNRGPDSLAALRFVHSLGDSAITVLGNHDLHLLAHAYGHGKLSPKDTLNEILNAPDREELLNWLRHRPVMHYDAKLNTVLCHAGIYPQWDLQTAQSCANELQNALRSDDCEPYFKQMYGNKPDIWDERLEGQNRLRFITNSFTRMRYCTVEGKIDLKHKGAPGTQPQPYLPWFEIPLRPMQNINILFGHWSTVGNVVHHNIVALDTGCLWGGKLTALILENNNQQLVSIDCRQTLTPG